MASRRTDQCSVPSRPVAFGWSGQRYELPEHVLVKLGTTPDDRALLFDLAADEYYELDHVGREVIRAIQAGLTRDLVIQQVAQSSGVPVPVASEAVQLLLSDLVGAGLIQASTHRQTA